jgi:hypothetical protein
MSFKKDFRVADKDFARGERVNPQRYRNPTVEPELLNSVMPLSEGGLKSELGLRSLPGLDLEAGLNPAPRRRVASPEPMTMPASSEYAETPEGRQAFVDKYVNNLPDPKVSDGAGPKAKAEGLDSKAGKDELAGKQQSKDQDADKKAAEPSIKVTVPAKNTKVAGSIALAGVGVLAFAVVGTALVITWQKTGQKKSEPFFSSAIKQSKAAGASYGADIKAITNQIVAQMKRDVRFADAAIEMLRSQVEQGVRQALNQGQTQQPAKPQAAEQKPAPISTSEASVSTQAPDMLQTPMRTVPSSFELEALRKQEQRAATTQKSQDRQQQQEAAERSLWAKQAKLSETSGGFAHHMQELGKFEDSLTQQQRQDLKNKVAARQNELLALAKQATHQLQKSDIQDLQTQVKLQVLYENYIPAREIYHFGKNFLNGYTPQKMQAVRGYFDSVFAGTYSKSIPAEKRSAIEAEADRKYTVETGKQADRESLLWKTLRNVQASEKYPNLWHRFVDDLNQPQGRRTGTMKTMTNTNNPALGSNALNRQGQSQPLDRSRLKQESFPTGEAQQKQQPVGGGFDNSVNPELVKQQEGFPTNQKVDGVTNVFESQDSNLREGFSAHPSTPTGAKGRPLKVPAPANQAEAIGGRTFSGHALDRMQRQGIVPTAAENTIQQGQKSIGKTPGTTAYYDPVNNLTVITDTKTGDVITVDYGQIKQ